MQQTRGAEEDAVVASACHLRGQGATEYLVMLGMVLLIAMVAIAMLGFFPGTAGDAQETQSKIYWQSASPIAITESSGISWSWVNASYTILYLRIRNTGNYPITIIRVLGANQTDETVWNEVGGVKQISEYSVFQKIPPGGEAYFGCHPGMGVNQCYSFSAGPATDCQPICSNCMCAASSICEHQANGQDTGYLVIADFGFEYIEYVEGQEISKKEIGTRDLIVRCGS